MEPEGEVEVEAYAEVIEGASVVVIFVDQGIELGTQAGKNSEKFYWKFCYSLWYDQGRPLRH